MQYFQPCESDSFWKKSKFGYYAHKVFELCDGWNAEAESRVKDRKYERNKFYSKDFLNYLKKHIYPYFPILTNLVFEATGVVSSTYTTNAIGKVFFTNIPYFLYSSSGQYRCLKLNSFEKTDSMQLFRTKLNDSPMTNLKQHLNDSPTPLPTHNHVPLTLLPPPQLSLPQHLFNSR